MWKLFSTKKKPAPGGWSVLDSVLQLTATTQRKCCGWMNSKSRHWTPRQNTIFLVLFCLLFLSGSGFLLWRTFRGARQPVTVSIGRIPLLPRMPASPVVEMTDKDVHAILEFSRFLDSLQTTPAGQKQYQQLATARPGMIDSLKTLQQYLLNK